MNSKYMHACQDLLFGDNQSLHALHKMVDIVNKCLYTLTLERVYWYTLLKHTAETHTCNTQMQHSDETDG